MLPVAHGLCDLRVTPGEHFYDLCFVLHTYEMLDVDRSEGCSWPCQ